MIKKYLTAALLLVAAVPAVAASGWGNAAWQERRKVTLDSRPIRGLTQEVKRAPVLVRLHSGVLDFSQVRPDGGDLRFVAGDDKTPLNYHIERFDPVAELGLVWVDVPAIAPGASQDIWLYYGNQAAKPVGDAAASYDGEQSLVLHFGEASAAPVDQTANHNRVTAFTGRPTVEGLVAGGATMTAQSQLRVAASASLTVPAAGKMTWSAWIKPAASGQPGDAVLYTKLSSAGDAGPDRVTVGLRDGVPYVRLAGASTGEAVASGPAAPGTWTHIAIVVGDAVTLYVNGAAVGTVNAKLPALGGDEVIGSFGGVPGFAGDIDEVNRANTDRSASAIALAAASQSRSSTLTAIAPTGEKAGSGGVNYFGILFSALTPDAWAVIGLLGIMLVISWVVMIGKGIFLRRTAGANQGFLDDYQKAAADRGAHDGIANPDAVRWTQDSSLARLFVIGRREIATRETEHQQGGRGRFALAPQSVAAIRSALDAGLAREAQKLNSRLVLLTIAISGGPFIGLLGTVLGVMITFAAVAAAGDVNINAIAPGIAAALLATVAGLAVAIPALFGYNYLLSQVEEISTENLIFVDELEKRLAETYRGSTGTSPVSIAAE
ncbi:MotA/TolQ/ExbB proton channel family protein [Sphingomonas sp. ERG5]|uniref:MotA/TolQ/ExbB proton channel family protein n=1 Tax=Sphingomonas sp. ERG5 TaxID=1381597 RepID=UPI0006908E58|nr:MotA/TolQ/ExbB proton channel family protein [Sphingomonas sp. ERG5]